ncbi:P-loop containing nucleoside triphosphate hydrolase protein [Xylaria sp. CBS 124048]|nr:P-loop containing nucleoside triphosphate hydrolase protein [Xylaria sp. CBS 124048]
MDMDTLLGALPMAVAANVTPTAGNMTRSHDMPLNIVESILPLMGLRGFAPVYQFIGSRLGWDPTMLLSLLGFVWAANKIARQVYHFLHGLVTEYMMSTVHISSTDDIYLHLMTWLSKQPTMINSRSLTAETMYKTAWEDEDESVVARDHSGVYLNFSNQQARATPQYIPAIGQHGFWWKGQYFRLHRKRESIYDESSWAGIGTFKDKEDLMISCFWRNPDPIKQLMAHAKEQYYSDHQARTMVKRPTPLSVRRIRSNNWQQVANRPVRDMATVVLDQQQKLQVLADMNEYLHPATPLWYANRGIPLRRGYLFHGPPGTGKTSLSFALAGVFGLDIYVISLLEPTLTEEDLSSLFSSLPRRCVVLLEDIDTAGLRRPADEVRSIEQASQIDGESSTEIMKATTSDIKELAKVLKKESEDQKKGISLSGLLNAIDGVASHEGRILIMTTNVPESLDDALIRPGRVDLQVQFTYATKEQARELFIRMYEGDQSRSQRQQTQRKIDSKPVTAANGHHHHHLHRHRPETNPSDLDVPDEQLSELARLFSEKIPAGEFSPAEIQGYLLKRKKNPRRAVEEADKWVAALVRQKTSKTKILQVQ